MAQPWHGRLAWYELMTTDPKAAEGFYGKVVGWTAQPFPGMEPPYTTWMSGDQPVGGLAEGRRAHFERGVAMAQVVGRHRFSLGFALAVRGEGEG